MRNLKKLLALVLAMAMTLSLMLTVSAADVKFEDYGDKDSITAEFVEGVKVLTGLKVFQGDEKGFRPSDSITRAEAAAIVYRLATGDVNNRQNDLYKDYGTFTDVNSNDWFAGYVGYCQNAGYIKGTSATTFNPYGKVTGYEALAMILRVVGYGKNNEFTGAQWQVNVAALSRQLGVTKHVTAAHMEETLNMAAPREVVADLLFMCAATVPTVTFTPALAYNDKQNVLGGKYNPTLGQQTFGLWYETNWFSVDEWARPGYRWYKNGTDNGGVTNALTGKAYAVKDNHPTYSGPKGGNRVATIMAKLDYDTKVQVRECDVADALDINTEDTFELFVNGNNVNYTTNGAVSNNYRIVATDTVTKVGGQGRVSEFYYELERESEWFDETSALNVAVMIDTMLAQVTAKTDAKLDPAGHVITPAQLEVTIWDGPNAGATVNTAANGTASNKIITKASDDKSNWDEYSKGDFILLNAYTNKNGRGGSTTTEDSAAFETNKVIANTSGWAANILEINASVWIVDNGNKGIAQSLQGKQTVTYWNQNKHQMDGKDYDDQICLFMDKAGSVTNTTFTWFFDQYGNLIGIGDAHATNFGVITSVYAAFGTGEDDTTGAVKAVANVRFSNGETGTVTIDRFVIPFGTAIPAGDNAGANVPGGTNDGTSYNLTPGSPVTPANTASLSPVYDAVGHSPLSAAEITLPDGATKVNRLYVAPSSVTNTNAHFTQNSSDAFNILYNNLFRFTVANDNAVVATMVAGQWNATNNGTDDAVQTNVPAFRDLANALTDSDTLGVDSKLYKNLGYMALETNDTTTPDVYVYLTGDTQIMVKMGNNTAARTINCYTLDTLPGDVTIPNGTEVDWADIDNDGRADVVYIANGSIPSTITYGLFYYNPNTVECNAQWDAATSTGTITGYLNGDAKTITTNNRGAFDAIQGTGALYEAHLYAVQFTNDKLTNVMVAENSTYVATNRFQQILASEAASPWTNATNVVLSFDTTPANNDNRANKIQLSSGWTWNAADATDADREGMFGLGAAFGNTYTTSNEAVYYRDTNNNTPATNAVRWERVSNGNQIVVQGAGTKTYWLAPNCKIVGELSWLNSGMTCYVTMVYDTAAADAVTEIYISHDPDVTPIPGPGVAGVATRPINTVGAAPSVSTPATDAALTAALKSGAAGTVLYSTVKSTDGTITPTVGGAAAANLIYFTYSVAGTPTTSLEITNAATGALVYSESLKVTDHDATGGWHFYVVDFRGGSNAGYGPGLPLMEGNTYNFRITTNTATGVVTLSSGTFSTT